MGQILELQITFRETINHIRCQRIGGDRVAQAIFEKLLYAIDCSYQVGRLHGNHQFFVLQPTEFSISKAGNGNLWLSSQNSRDPGIRASGLANKCEFQLFIPVLLPAGE